MSEKPHEDKPYWTGPGYRWEYNCPHGVGHGNHVHGCDGCCRRVDFPLNKKNLAKTRAAEILRGVGPFRAESGAQANAPESTEAILSGYVEVPEAQPYRVEYVSVPRDLLDEVVEYLDDRLVYTGARDKCHEEYKRVFALIRRLEECSGAS